MDSPVKARLIDPDVGDFQQSPVGGNAVAGFRNRMSPARVRRHPSEPRCRRGGLGLGVLRSSNAAMAFRAFISCANR